MTLTKPLEMKKLLDSFRKTTTNPYIGVLLSLVLMIPSLYIILEDMTVLRKEYVFLVAGIPIYIKSLSKIFDNLLNKDSL